MRGIVDHQFIEICAESEHHTHGDNDDTWKLTHITHKIKLSSTVSYNIANAGDKSANNMPRDRPAALWIRLAKLREETRNSDTDTPPHTHKRSVYTSAPSCESTDYIEKTGNVTQHDECLRPHSKYIGATANSLVFRNRTTARSPCTVPSSWGVRGF